MLIPAHAEPAVVAVQGHPDRYIADQAWLAEGMLHALGRWEHVEGASTERTTRLYGERSVRSWSTRAVSVQWSPEDVVADVLLRVVSA